MTYLASSAMLYQSFENLLLVLSCLLAMDPVCLAEVEEERIVESAMCRRFKNVK